LEGIRWEEPVAPSVRNPRVASTFDAPLLQALNKDPDGRYQTAGEFLEALRAAAATRKRRNQSETSNVDLAAELYTIRTLRDLLGEAQQALARLDAPWVRDNDTPEVIAERGETLLVMGEPGEGYRLLEQAVSLNPSLPFAQMALAEHYRDVDQDLYTIAMV